jgi:hypothetical protein
MNLVPKWTQPNLQTLSICRTFPFYFFPVGRVLMIAIPSRKSLKITWGPKLEALRVITLCLGDSPTTEATKWCSSKLSRQNEVTVCTNFTAHKATVPQGRLPTTALAHIDKKKTTIASLRWRGLSRCPSMSFRSNTSGPVRSVGVPKRCHPHRSSWRRQAVL